ncbi:leucine-rich repeat-containing protein 51-like isoform X2 [Lytechinus variegatus]|uniref:leucine-rich repeat-containing protein 51-like isoform X2 n=1 Tax=Lytechinus variegatus TaxID=7654 RepID=UPI001BB0E78E|nr:leucine-rich repeat-containing protein 51-like isoform X2 [Lytechinus variegatus]
MDAFYQQIPRPDFQKSHVTRNAKPIINSFDERFPYTAPPLDFSFMNIGNFDSYLHGKDDEPRQQGLKNLTKTEDGKYSTTTLKMNNNLLQEWKGFEQFLQDILASPQELYWLDLSFNYLITIDEVILNFPNIRILYLHGNAIEDVKEIDKLAQLQHLFKLTLHGNPVESDPGYRQRVLSKLPNLKTLDCSEVTKADREKSQVYVSMVGDRNPTAKKKHARSKTK